MRILAISPYFPPDNIGGHEIRCKNIVDGLNNLGHEVFVITNHPVHKGLRQANNEAGIYRVLHLTKNRLPALYSIFLDYVDLIAIKNIFSEFKPDLVYLFGIQNLGISILPFFSRINIPLVFDEGGSNLALLTRKYKNGLYFYHKINQGIFKNTLKNSILTLVRNLTGGLIDSNWIWPANMKIIYNSQSALEFSQENGVDTTNAVVIRPGIDTQLFGLKPRNGLSTPVSILLAGRIKQIKGTSDGLYLLQNLVKLGIEANLKIVGDVEDPSYLQELIRMAQELRIEQFVTIESKVDQVSLSKYYTLTDICFFPSYYRTGFSRTPLEAMACGAIVLGYGSEGLSSVIKSGETGFIIPDGDITAASEVIQKLLTIPGLANQISSKARELIETDYSMDHYIKRINHFLTTGPLV